MSGVTTRHSARPGPYCARLAKGSNQLVGPTSYSVINGFTVEYDFPGGMFNSGAASRLTALVGGIYYAAVCVSFQLNSVGIRQAYIMKNGATYPVMVSTAAPTSQQQTCYSFGGDFYLAQGDYIETGVYHSSNVALNIEGASYKTTMSLRLVSATLFKDWS